MNDWDPLAESPGLAQIEIAGVPVKPGDRVVLRPQRRADIMDIALDGMTATIESIQEDFEGRIHLAVTVDDDPGKEFGQQGKPAHRFFFGIDEVDPLTISANIDN